MLYIITIALLAVVAGASFVVGRATAGTDSSRSDGT